MMALFGSRKLAAALAAGIVGASALLAGTTGTASAAESAHATASQLRPVADSWITGLPAHVRRGSTVTFTVWYRVEHTRQSFMPLLYGTDIQNSGVWGPGQYRGISFQFYDVVTHRWEGPVADGGTASRNFQIGGRYGGPLVAAGGLGHVTFRMHVGRSTYLGHWRIAGSVTGFLMPSGEGSDGLAKLDRFTVTR